ncbi:glutaconate CoA-transferase subunit A [Peptoniphilus equinus]|uniref:Glutaconate CoA-transferase subunit A n=1 Tax=Peptoniphilus equinus TaxID=3016343 RepID=A0ABY7QT45_9FIRM|nr:glutaconate CoA-transferase subunit A [Peptoniphilus equinus]WBW49952.1 glutaconate CoA-transferase subunit A [Peptoniphilus equinus]
MSKIMNMKDAISKFVHDGDVISFGGFTTNRKPYAAVYEILRQGQKDFIVEAGPAGGDWDMMIGEGRVTAYINCYTANSGYTNVSRRFRKAIEHGDILFEDYSQDVEMMRLHAASLGLSYLPVKLMLGSDVAEKWGISEEERAKHDKLPNKKYEVVENPFAPGEKVLVAPVPKIDTAVIHAQMASPDGTVRIVGPEFHDIDIAIAAKHTIVTVEEIVSNEYIRREPTKNSIPGFCVDAIVHAPFGAHPAQCYDFYDYDPDFFKYYNVVSKGDDDFKGFMTEWVYDMEDHNAYLNKLGASRLLNLKVVPGYGYATDVLKKDDKEAK